MYECSSEWSKEKHGKTYVYVAHIGTMDDPLGGPISRICPSENSACNYLDKLGFVMADPDDWGEIGLHYVHKRYPVDRDTLKRHYTLIDSK